MTVPISKQIPPIGVPFLDEEQQHQTIHPIWYQFLVNFTNQVITTITGIVGISQGGTGANITPDNGAIVYSNASTLALLASTATVGKILQSGSHAAPSWSTPTYPSLSGSAGKLIRADGTNNVYSTSTFADTYTINNILFASAGNTVTGLATANNGVLITSSGGVPSVGNTLPTAVQGNITSTGTITSGTWNASFSSGLTIPTPNITGVTNASNATAGSLQESTSSTVLSGSAVSLTTATPKDVTSISLTAGDWDVEGNVSFNCSVGASALLTWISTTSATVPDTALYNSITDTSAINTLTGINTPYKRINVNTTTTVYLSCQATFASGTATACGGIFARRVR